MADRVRVTPSGLSVNYAPDYLAADLGYFREQDLEVDSSVNAGPGSSWLADNLVSGKADIAMGGIWIPLMYRHRIAELPICAVVCSRNPQTIQSRSLADDFRWQDLYDKQFVLPLESTSQWMFLQGAMLEAGVDLERIQFIRDLHVETTTNLWRAGFGDFYLTTPPLSDELAEDGYPVATTLAESCGAVPWSVYYSTPDFIARDDDPVGRYAEAVEGAMKWILSHPDTEVAQALQSRFSHVPQSRLASVIGGMKERGVWAGSVTIPEEPFMRYQGMIAAYGLIREPFPFADVVTDLASKEL